MEKDRIKNFDRRIRQLIKNFGAARVLENYEKQIYSWVEGILPEGTYESLTKLIIICEKWAGQKSPEINFTPNSVEYPYREVCKELTEVVTILTPQLFAKILHKQRDKCAKEDLFYEISDIFSQLQGDSINYIVKRLENKKLRAAKKLTFPELRPKKIQKQLEARLMRALEINYQDEVLPQAYRARDCLIRDEIDNMFCEAQFATRETTEVSALGEVKAAHQKAQQQINRARRAGRGN